MLKTRRDSTFKIEGVQLCDVVFAYEANPAQVRWRDSVRCWSVFDWPGTRFRRGSEHQRLLDQTSFLFSLMILGWGDLSCYGRPDYRTPNLDRLASQGTKFTDAYSASAVCTPTRCGFITGRYPARTKIGLIEPLPTNNHSVGLDPGHPTIASLLKQTGYETALIGKWHLGFRPEWGPNAHGFDEFFGVTLRRGGLPSAQNWFRTS